MSKPITNAHNGEWRLRRKILHTLDDYARAIYGEIYVTAAEVIFITLGPGALSNMINTKQKIQKKDKLISRLLTEL